jgi:hypothetical protein
MALAKIRLPAQFTAQQPRPIPDYRLELDGESKEVNAAGSERDSAPLPYTFTTG